MCSCKVHGLGIWPTLGQFLLRAVMSSGSWQPSSWKQTAAMDTCPDSTQNTRVTGNRTEHAPKTAHAVSMETRGGRKQSDTVHVLSPLSWESTYTHRLTKSLATQVTTNLISHTTNNVMCHFYWQRQQSYGERQHSFRLNGQIYICLDHAVSLCFECETKPSQLFYLEGTLSTFSCYFGSLLWSHTIAFLRLCMQCYFIRLKQHVSFHVRNRIIITILLKCIWDHGNTIVTVV